MPTHFKGDSGTKRALNALINLSRASNSVQTRLSVGLDRHGITTSQLGILEALFHLGPMCQRALGDKLLRSGGNITMVIDNLEKHGLVQRVRQEDDRRMIVIHLTSPGRKLISRVLPQHAKEVVKEMSRLTASEQEELRRLCRKLGRGGEANLENDHDNSESETKE
ncbi:MAG TPA: MarR family transcriptional regulator [Candidatus Binatus sp.]|nr:MarR family transcriptional regulator [Candidatus Binatus sp.]